MQVFRVALLLFGLAFCHAGWAQAILPPFTNLRVVPNPAPAGQPIVARLFSSGCATIPTTNTITIQDHVVTLTHETEEICGVPLPGADWDFPVGAFAPGQYTLVYAPTSGFSGNTYVTQSVQFVVVGRGIPASSIAALTILALALLGFGALRMEVKNNPA